MTSKLEQSLTEALNLIGITHKPDELTDGDGRHAWFTADGTAIGRYDAYEGWEKLKAIVAKVATELAA